MVKNKFSEEEIQIMNNLLTGFFQMNQDCDNLAYALDSYLACPVASSIYHQKYAHQWPSDSLADALSDALVKEGVIPHRYAQEDHFKMYGNVAELFDDNYEYTEKIKQMVIDAIEVLDYNKDCKPIVVLLEDMARILSQFLHQSDIWKGKAHAYLDSGKIYKFDIDFEDFTIL